jgi:hypothetical protein
MASTPEFAERVGRMRSMLETLRSTGSLSS